MISETFVKRPLTAIVIAIVIVLLGILSLLNLPISQYPSITPPVVSVTATYPGADALTVEQTVTTPLESQINGSPGMTYFQSTSNNNGSSQIQVYYNLGTDINIAMLDVQNRANIALPSLPSDVQRLGVTVLKRNPSILMLIALYSPNETHDSKFVDNYANLYVRDALLRVPGVGDINVRADPFSIRIWLRPDVMSQMNITTNEVVAALQEQNFLISAGSIGAPPQNDAQSFEYTVLTNSRLSDAEDFKDIIVRSNPRTGSITYLKDIARVELGKYSYGNSYVDGKKAAYLLVYQAPGSNAISVANGVYATMVNLKKEFPEDIEYVVPFETVSVVDASITEVVHTLVIALLLVLLVVYLFLQNWRATLIPMLAIPVSIIGTFSFFVLLGFSINTLTLFGFVLAIGIVVDDAIVVVEAAQNNLDSLNISAKEATLKAMESITAPVIAIALILSAVFIPVGFVPGIVGRLYQQFAITIAVSVLISAFVALTLTPALCSLLLRPRTEKERPKGIDRFFAGFNRIFDKMNTNYGKGVAYGIKKAPLVIIFLIGICVVTIVLFRNKPTGFIPIEDEGRLYITYELPEASSTKRGIQVMDSLMKIISTIPEVGHIAGIGGLNVVSGSQKSNCGTIFCQLRPWDERTKKSQQLQAVIQHMQKKFTAIKGANTLVIIPPAIPGLGSTGGFSFILEQKSSTDDIKTFERNLHSFVAEVNKRPEIASAFSFFTASTPGYQLNVDREKTKRMGVSLTDVYSTIQTFLASRYVNDFTIYGRNFKVLTEADTAYRNDISNLNQYYVRNQEGNMVPLGGLIDYHVIESPATITHYNLFRSAEIDGSAAVGHSSGEAIQALMQVAGQTLPRGYGFEFSGLSREEIKSGSTTYLIFSLSILFVFLFLVALYESWSLPFSVLLAVPLGAFGAILTLTLLPSLSNSVYAQIGLVTLIGLAAKNAILIVEYAKERLESGIPLVEAVLEAVRVRLRPILMTSIAFILGVLPLAFADGAGSVSRQTIGWTVLGGMLAATLLAVFTVPVLFVLITRLAYSGKMRNEE